LKGGSIESRVCPTGNTQYFRFDPPKGRGYGGRRAYGQDVEVHKLVELTVEGKVVVVVDMDFESGLPPSGHGLGDNRVLFTQVVKEGKTTVLHLTTHVEIVNRTLLPFEVEVVDQNDESHRVGRCLAKNTQLDTSTPSTVPSGDGVDSKKSKSFSIPIPLLTGFCKDWESRGKGKLTLRLIPLISEFEKSAHAVELSGKFDLMASLLELRRAPDGLIKSNMEVTCRSHELGREIHPFSLQVVLSMMLVADENVVITVSLEPRAVIENRIPLPMKFRTPMPQTFSKSRKEEVENKETTYELEPDARIEVFTPGPSIAMTMRPRDTPVAGNELGWMEAGWVDLPLVPEFRLQDPIVSELPFANERERQIGETNRARAEGAEVFIVEGSDALESMLDTTSPKNTDSQDSPPPIPANNLQSRRSTSIDETLSFFLTVCYYGVDHTGSILFEQVMSASHNGLQMMTSLWQSERSISDLSQSKRLLGANSFLDEFDVFSGPDASQRRLSQARLHPRPLGAFSSPRHRRRISLLSNARSPIRLLQMTMEGDEGLRRTLPFLIEELPIGDGGAATVPIFWEDKSPTGHFAYRRLVNAHQSEIHVVPEFIVFNGSKNALLVKERNMPEVLAEAGETGQLRALARPNGLEVLLNFFELGCQTSTLQVGKLGLRVAIVRSYEGIAVGCVYVQTVIDTHGDSRLVVKVSDVMFGSLSTPGNIREESFFAQDFCRFRVRWTELQLILNEIGESGRESWHIRKLRSPRNQVPIQSTTIPPSRSESPTKANRNPMFNFSPPSRGDDLKEPQLTQRPIMATVFSRFTVDFQRVFKDGDKKTRRGSLHVSPERSQISVIVHNVQIKDLTPDSPYPMVFDCTSDISFIDLCVRIRGPTNADLVKVDLFDLNLAHRSGRSEKMVLTTSEAYVWRILDLINRILRASGEVAGFTLKFEDDSEHGGYVIKIEDQGKSRSRDSDKYKYTPPKADTLYDVALARVSPFTLVVSFRRSPDLARYTKAKGANAPGAAITNYFTRKLKFTIEKAELNFARYEDRSLRGPSDRLLETLSTVYVGRMKYKVVSLLSAASLQDWRFLAARDTGDDEYMEGDILRATGNIAGKSAGFVLKAVGRGVGGAVSGVSTFVGDGIEGGASKIGARRLGSGVSSVVTGVGHGVGDTLSGVGTGAGKIIQGAGQGVGHVFGGLSGGVLQVGKGIGKGIATGDGMAVVDGFTKGATSVGGGISQGAESAVMGAANGVFSAGKGLFSGVRSVSQGIGGAISGKKPSQLQKKKSQEGGGNGR